jgi:deazaflavin-dependent oxidoreductase (nitroreductase family)
MTAADTGTFGRRYRRADARLQGFFTTLHTAAYRLTGGRVGQTLFGMPMLLLTTRGRKTGRLRTAPLLYLPDGPDLVLVGSNGGAQRSPTWVYNLESYPAAIVQIGPARGEVGSRRATPEERARLWPRMVAVYPGYADYQRKTDREIPLLLLTPRDQALYDAVPPRFRAHMP